MADLFKNIEIFAEMMDKEIKRRDNLLEACFHRLCASMGKCSCSFEDMCWECKLCDELVKKLAVHLKIEGFGVEIPTN